MWSPRPQIASELRNKRPEHFVDELALADLCAFLEYYRDGAERSFRRRDFWRHFSRLLRLLCSIHFLGSACTMARLWDCRDLNLDHDRRIRGGAAQLRALHHSRTGPAPPLSLLRPSWLPLSGGWSQTAR